MLGILCTTPRPPTTFRMHSTSQMPSSPSLHHIPTHSCSPGMLPLLVSPLFTTNRLFSHHSFMTDFASPMVKNSIWIPFLVNTNQPATQGQIMQLVTNIFPNCALLLSSWSTVSSSLVLPACPLVAQTTDLTAAVPHLHRQPASTSHQTKSASSPRRQIADPGSAQARGPA